VLKIFQVSVLRKSISTPTCGTAARISHLLHDTRDEMPVKRFHSDSES
jgi:hypothetical protein